MINIDDIKYFCTNNNIDIHMTVFELKKLSPHKDFYVKEFLYTSEGDKKVEFKGISDYFFPQVFKTYYNIPLLDYDKVFYFEHEIAFFKDFIPLMENK